MDENKIVPGTAEENNLEISTKTIIVSPTQREEIKVKKRKRVGNLGREKISDWCEKAISRKLGKKCTYDFQPSDKIKIFTIETKSLNYVQGTRGYFGKLLLSSFFFFFSCFQDWVSNPNTKHLCTIRASYGSIFLDFLANRFQPPPPPTRNSIFHMLLHA